MLKSKGVLIASAVAAASLLLAGCASQGSACGNTDAQPMAVAPAPAAMPVNSCKGQSECKGKMRHHRHHHMHHAKKMMNNDEGSTTTTTTTTSDTTTPNGG